MKKWTALFSSCLLVVSLCLVPVAGCTGGCKSSPRTAYVTSGVTHVAAVTGLKGWNEYLGQAYAAAAANTDTNKAATAKADLLKKEQQVKAAWEKYQATQIAALTTAQEFAKIPPNDPNSPAAQDRLNAVLAASSAALSELIGVLKQFGIKIGN